MTLEDHYAWLLEAEHDMRHHLPVLRDYASRCDHVTEFGVRHGVSTTAFLTANPITLSLYDVVRYPSIDVLLGLTRHTRTRVRFYEADTRQVTIAPTDLLLIDTVHTAVQVYAELCRHAPQVRQYLVFHDTETCGERDLGQSGAPLGVRWGIGRYLHEQEGVWTRDYDTTLSHGLWIYRRR